MLVRPLIRIGVPRREHLVVMAGVWCGTGDALLTRQQLSQT
jgi:hypothetical protein